MYFFADIIFKEVSFQQNLFRWKLDQLKIFNKTEEADKFRHVIETSRTCFRLCCA